MAKAPRFPDPALQAIADEFAEVLRVKLNAEEKLDELFDTIAEELVGYEQRFSDQEIRAITEGIEAMRAMVATPAGGYVGRSAPRAAEDKDRQQVLALLAAARRYEDHQRLLAPPERRPWWRRIVG
jgi:hypothetical protein